LTVLPGAIKENLDYRSLIGKYDNDALKTVFYFDPPYLIETRRSQRRLYTFDWQEQEHYEFLERCRMISHYPCKLYDDGLKSWRRMYYQSMTRGGVRTECVYMNFSPPALLLDHQYIGDNFTDRQRIKRKVARLISRLNRETPQERAAILSAVVDSFSYLKKAT
jgi:DNA adenine methylase